MLVEKQLGQLRPANTTAASLYSPGAERAIIKSIVVCNTTATAATFRIFIDDDGSTYDQDSALFYDAPIQANETVEISTYWPMNNSAGNLGVRTGTADAINFTAFGVIVS